MSHPLCLFLGVSVWLVCAVLSAGITFAWFQDNPEFSSIAKQDYRMDLLVAWSAGLSLGPIYLLAIFFFSDFCKYGWRLK